MWKKAHSIIFYKHSVSFFYFLRNIKKAIHSVYLFVQFIQTNKNVLSFFIKKQETRNKKQANYAILMKTVNQRTLL